MLSPVARSCTDVCPGPVDVSALYPLGSSSEVVAHLEALYGISATSKDGIDLPCGPPEKAMYVFIPEGFRNFGGNGRWHCLEGERYDDVTASVRLPCTCDVGSSAAPAPSSSWLPSWSWGGAASPPPPRWIAPPPPPPSPPFHSYRLPQLQLPAWSMPSMPSISLPHVDSGVVLGAFASTNGALLIVCVTILILMCLIMCCEGRAQKRADGLEGGQGPMGGGDGATSGSWPFWAVPVAADRMGPFVLSPTRRQNGYWRDGRLGGYRWDPNYRKVRVPENPYGYSGRRGYRGELL